MSAPTNFRVEAIAQGTNILRWTNNSGAGNIGIYRSTTSSSTGFSLVATVAGSDESYIDDGLPDATRHWYKASDDAGTTFSSPVVSVVTYVDPTPHFNAQPGMSMPSPLEDSGEAFQRQLQEYQNKQQLAKTPCDICIQNGAIVLDCSTGCQFFRVIVDQDINSISLVGCEECPQCDMIIPPGEEFGICGWPVGCEYSWDECFEAPVSGGVGGRTAKTNGLSYGGYGSPGSGPRPPSQCCDCDSTERDSGSGDALRIVGCDGATIGCGDSKKFKACGGAGPYTWSGTGSIQLSAATGICITVTSTATPGTGTDPLEIAYIKYVAAGANNIFSQNNCGPGIHGWVINGQWNWGAKYYNCNQQLVCQSGMNGSNTCPGVGANTSKICHPTNPTFTVTSSCCSGCGFPNQCVCSASSSLSFSGTIDPVDNPPNTGCNGATINFSFNVPENTGTSQLDLQQVGETGFVDLRSVNSCLGGSDVCSQGSTTLTVTDAAGVSATIVLA